METIEWLLEEKDPSARYFTLTRLLEEPEESPAVRETRKRILESGPAAYILARQNPAGYWDAPEKFYTAKYTGTVWQVLMLAELGAPGDDPRIRKACEFILDAAQDREGGGFSMKRSARNGGGLPGEVIPCLTGNMAWSLLRFGMGGDPRVQKAVDWICRYQRSDDGNTRPPAGPPL